MQAREKKEIERRQTERGRKRHDERQEERDRIEKQYQCKQLLVTLGIKVDKIC